MTVCKENRSTGKIVIVDTTANELGKLPQPVQTAFGAAGTFWPKVVITDPAMTKVYGKFSYEQLKPQKYRPLFRDACRDFKADADAGTLPAPGAAKAPEVANNGGAPANAPASVDFQPTDFEEWRSASGTTITAKLVAVDDSGRFVFEDRNGKKIPVAPAQLATDSRQRATAATGRN